MEKTYKCVSGEIVALNDAVTYVYRREDIEPLLRDMFTLCYPKYPVMVNGMMFDGASITKWRDNNSYRDPVTRARFDLDSIAHIYALKFVLLCLEDTFDDTQIVYKTVVDDAGVSKQVFDREATNTLYKNAVVKFHSPPSNILHACKLAECLIGNNNALVDGQPAPHIIDKRINLNVELTHPDHVEIDGVIRTSAYAINRGADIVYKALADAIEAGSSGFGGVDFNSVSFSCLPQGFRLVGCSLINCSQFDHLELIDCQVLCDYKCYPISYYMTASANNSAINETPLMPCNKLVMGHNMAVSLYQSRDDVVEDIKKLKLTEVTPVMDKKPYDALILPIPPIYKSLQSVRHVNDVPELPMTPIINYNIRLQVGRWRHPLLVGMLTHAEMMNPERKFDRCYDMMTLINTNPNFKQSVREFNDWVGKLSIYAHRTVFAAGNYEAAKRRQNLPKMVDSETWHDLSGLDTQNWRFVQCYFKDTTFAGSNMNSVRFEDCEFDNVDFTLTALNGVSFKNCKFTAIQPAHGIEHANVKYIDCTDIENIFDIVPGTIGEPKALAPSFRPMSSNDDSDDSDSD